jgi:hypothetical protein
MRAEEEEEDQNTNVQRKINERNIIYFFLENISSARAADNI